MGKRSVEEIINLAKRIAVEKFVPRASEIDQNQTFPWENIRILGETGLLGLIISEKEGGFGANRLQFASVAKEIAKACVSTGLVYVSHLIVAKAIEYGGSEMAKKTFFSDMLKGRGLAASAVVI